MFSLCESVSSASKPIQRCAAMGIPGLAPPPHPPGGEAVVLDRCGPHRDAGAGGGRRLVAAPPDHARVDEVLMEVGHVLYHAALKRAADADKVEYGLVLDVLAEADAAGVGAHGNAELGGEEHDGDNLVHAAEAA